MSTPTGGDTDRPDPSSDLPSARVAPGAAGSAPPAGREVASETVAEPFTHRARRGVLALASVLVVYYAAPVGALPSGIGIVLSVLGLLAGVGLLAWLIVRQGRRLMHSAPDDESVRLESLVFLVYVVVPTFALGYFALEHADSAQFASLSTKTDALYFTLSTLATVGFGDVHATGQLARVLVIVQIAFDLVFVAALVSLLTTQIRDRAASRRVAAERSSGEP
jgi:voltage-gated potassium channel